MTVILSAALHPVEVKRKEIKDYNTFQKGKIEGAALNHRGELSIGPGIRAVAGPEAEYYLSFAAGSGSDYYIGTGHSARVYKIKSDVAPTPLPDGGIAGVEEIFRGDELDVYALLAARNGAIYAGTSPDGKLYKITVSGDKKEFKEFYDSEEKFIWDIKEDNAGNIILATGVSGAVFRVDSQGNSVSILASEDIHIVSLCIARSGAILAGSGDRGVLYKIDNTKIKVLYDSPLEEIRGICEDKEGNIFFSATRNVRKDLLKGAALEAISDKKKKDSDAATAIPEKSILHIRRPDGVVEKLWSSYTEYIYSIAYDEKTDTVLVSTGDSGRVHRINKDGDFSLVYESDAAQVFKLTPVAGGVAMITNNNASVAVIENTVNTKGVYLSEPFDLGHQSRLGKAYWDATASGAADVSLMVRAGNSGMPDDTWSKWSAPFNGGSAEMNIQDVRYFQVKINLNATNPANPPVFKNFRAYYLQSNLKPQIREITVTRGEKTTGTDAGEPGKQSEEPKKLDNLLQITWKADDYNRDKLKYSVFLKKTADKVWIPVKKDFTEAALQLDARLYQDGAYQLKVEADDALANPPGQAKSHSLLSSVFLVDSTAPVLEGLTVQARKLSFSVTDQTSVVSAVTYSYDGKLWYPVFPADGIADSGSEKYEFTLSDAPAGQRMVFIRATDEFDNGRVYQAEF